MKMKVAVLSALPARIQPYFITSLFARPVPNARYQSANGIAVSMSAEHALSEWIRVHSPLCAVRMDGSVHVKSTRPKRCRICVCTL